MAKIIGSNRSEKLSGTKHSDVIVGRGGNDKLDGGKGNDFLFGGSGHDKVKGGKGDDFLSGGSGKDKLDGGKGDDFLSGGSGNDKLDGGKGNDFLFGGSGNDKLEGGKGDDFLSGGSGNDRLDGGKGHDVLFGGAGHDKLDGGDGNDKIFGGDGDDRLEGGDGHDSLFGGSGNDKLDGEKGNDFLDGGAGNDWVKGGKGNDRANYNMAENLGPNFSDIGTHDIYDGGHGFDTLQLTLTYGEFLNDSVKNDLDAFQVFLDKHAKPSSDCGPTFHFTSFNLDARDFEALAVELVNEGPTASNDDAGVTDEDNAFGGAGLLVNDIDPDHLDELTVVGHDAESAQGAAVVVNADGSYTYNPTGALALQMLAAGTWVMDSFGYTVSDLAGATSSAVVQVKVMGLNDTPTDLVFEGGSVAEKAAFGTVVASVTSVADVDQGDTHVFSLTDNPGGFFAIDSTTGVITVIDGSLLNAGDSHAVTVRATDVGGLFYDEVLVIDVTGNSPPIAVSDTVITNVEPFDGIHIPEWALLANDSDPDGNPIDVEDGSVGDPVGGFPPIHTPGVGSGGLITFVTLDYNASFSYFATDGLASSVAPAQVQVSRDMDGDAELNGTANDDILVGRAFIGDTLNGGEGNDILVGGADDMDVFKFSFESDNTSKDGFDTIVDFVWGEDKLEFHGLPGLTLDQFKALFQVGEGDVNGDGVTDTTLALQDGTWEVNLLGVSGHDLDAFFNDSLFS